MKVFFKRLVCRVFGHRDYEEIFAERTVRYFPRKQLPVYMVVRELRCERCGEVHREVLRSGLHRSQMLKEGWFIEN